MNSCVHNQDNKARLMIVVLLLIIRLQYCSAQLPGWNVQKCSLTFLQTTDTFTVYVLGYLPCWYFYNTHHVRVTCLLPDFHIRRSGRMRRLLTHWLQVRTAIQYLYVRNSWIFFHIMYIFCKHWTFLKETWGTFPAVLVTTQPGFFFHQMLRHLQLCSWWPKQYMIFS